MCGDAPSIKNSTNIWAQKNSLDLVLTDIQQRGSEKHFFYNCFIQQFGTANKLIYFNELHSLYKQLQESKRNVCVVNKSISPPTPEEIATIQANMPELPDAKLSRYIEQYGLNDYDANQLIQNKRNQLRNRDEHGQSYFQLHQQQLQQYKLLMEIIFLIKDL